MPEHAPKTVENFTGLATGSRGWTDPRDGEAKSSPLYPGTIFHRDPRLHGPGRRPHRDGKGGPRVRGRGRGRPSFDRPGPSRWRTWAGTNGSQFFVTVAPTPWLDGKHTIFGEVTDGYEVIEAIGGVPTAAQDRPVDDVVIDRIEIAD